MTLAEKEAVLSVIEPILQTIEQDAVKDIKNGTHDADGVANAVATLRVVDTILTRIKSDINVTKVSKQS